MRRTVFLGTCITVGLLCGHSAMGQFPEDALRLGTAGTGVGARALGMGNAYAGVAGDYSAVFWNPAGLAQSRFGEMFAGFSYLGVNNQSTFFGGTGSSSASSTSLNALGAVFPVPVRRGSLVFALGYDRYADFASSLSFAGFNPSSSAIQQSAPDGVPYPSDLSGNLAYQLFLADIDTLSGRFVSPIVDRVTQRGAVTESGGLNNWSLAGAVDIARNVSLGVTLTYVSGSYKYDRVYEEEDVNNIYQTFPYDFGRYTVDEYVESDVTGVTARFGLMVREPDRYRIGFSVKAPTSYTVKEQFGESARSWFDNGDIKPDDGPFVSEGNGEYDVSTPWEFSGGGSVVFGDLLLAASAEFKDWKTLEFRNALPEIMALNRDIRADFRPVVNLSAGAELSLGNGPRLRAGFSYRPSPYEGDPSSFDQKMITGGLGVPLGPSVMLDVAYAHGWYDTFRINDGGTSRTDERIRTNTVLVTLISRF